MMIQLNKDNIDIGVISDTHGILRPEIFSLFSTVDHIVHAGDIGSRDIIEQLELIAPVLPILGNTDNPIKFPDLYDSAVLNTNHVSIYMIHNILTMDLDPKSAGFNAVICGHSHKPSIEVKKSILYFNPGSAGPKRFTLPVSAGILSIKGSTIYARNIDFLILNKAASGN